MIFVIKLILIGFYKVFYKFLWVYKENGAKEPVYQQCPFGVQRLSIYNEARRAKFADGWDGMDGWTEYQKCPSNFFILCEYIEHVYTYLYIYILKNCHQHSYGFQTLMSSWRSWSKFSKVQQVADVKDFLSKNSLL